MNDSFGLFDGDGIEMDHVQRLIQLSVSSRGHATSNAQLDAVNRTLGELLDHQRRQHLLPQCPWCGGRLEGRFELCQHCIHDLVWVENVPCKPGQEEAVRSALDQMRKRQAESKMEHLYQLAAEQKQAKEDAVLLWSVAAGVTIAVTGLVFLYFSTAICWMPLCIVFVLWAFFHLATFHSRKRPTY